MLHCLPLPSRRVCSQHVHSFTPTQAGLTIELGYLHSLHWLLCACEVALFTVYMGPIAACSDECVM